MIDPQALLDFLALAQRSQPRRPNLAAEYGDVPRDYRPRQRQAQMPLATGAADSPAISGPAPADENTDRWMPPAISAITPAHRLLMAAPGTQGGGSGFPPYRPAPVMPTGRDTPSESRGLSEAGLRTPVFPQMPVAPPRSAPGTQSGGSQSPWEAPSLPPFTNAPPTGDGTFAPTPLRDPSPLLPTLQGTPVFPQIPVTSPPSAPVPGSQAERAAYAARGNAIQAGSPPPLAVPAFGAGTQGGGSGFPPYNPAARRTTLAEQYGDGGPRTPVVPAQSGSQSSAGPGTSATSAPIPYGLGSQFAVVGTPDARSRSTATAATGPISLQDIVNYRPEPVLHQTGHDAYGPTYTGSNPTGNFLGGTQLGSGLDHLTGRVIPMNGQYVQETVRHQMLRPYGGQMPTVQDYARVNLGGIPGHFDNSASISITGYDARGRPQLAVGDPAGRARTDARTAQAVLGQQSFMNSLAAMENAGTGRLGVTLPENRATATTMGFMGPDGVRIPGSAEIAAREAFGLPATAGQPAIPGRMQLAQQAQQIAAANATANIAHALEQSSLPAQTRNMLASVLNRPGNAAATVRDIMTQLDAFSEATGLQPDASMIALRQQLTNRLHELSGVQQSPTTQSTVPAPTADPNNPQVQTTPRPRTPRPLGPIWEPIINELQAAANFSATNVPSAAGVATPGIGEFIRRLDQGEGATRDQLWMQRNLPAIQAYAERFLPGGTLAWNAAARGMNQDSLSGGSRYPFGTVSGDSTVIGGMPYRLGHAWNEMFNGPTAEVQGRTRLAELLRLRLLNQATPSHR